MDDKLHPCDKCIFNGYFGCSQYINTEDCPQIQQWEEGEWREHERRQKEEAD